MPAPTLPWNRIVLVLAITLVMLLALLLGYAYTRIGGGSLDGTGRALIGGPFELIDQNGESRTDRDFLGRPMLVYFGFTFCPDVCPTDLAKMAAAIDLLPPDAGVTPIFITVDPERDGPAEVKMYVEAFHPRLVGLTGTPEQIATAARAYRVYYARNDNTGATDYLIDHSAIIYLMDRRGAYAAHFTRDSTPEEIAARMRQEL